MPLNFISFFRLCPLSIGGYFKVMKSLIGTMGEEKIWLAHHQPELITFSNKLKVTWKHYHGWLLFTLKIRSAQMKTSSTLETVGSWRTGSPMISHRIKHGVDNGWSVVIYGVECNQIQPITLLSVHCIPDSILRFADIILNTQSPATHWFTY